MDDKPKGPQNDATIRAKKSKSTPLPLSLGKTMDCLQINLSHDASFLSRQAQLGDISLVLVLYSVSKFVRL